MKNKHQVFLNKSALKRMNRKIKAFIKTEEVGNEGFFDFLKVDNEDCRDVKFSAVSKMIVPTRYAINRAILTLGLTEYLAETIELQTQIDVYDTLYESYKLIAMINNSKGTKVPHSDLQYQIGNATSYLKLYQDIIGNELAEWKHAKHSKMMDKEITVGEIIMNHQDLMQVFHYANEPSSEDFSKKQLKAIKKMSKKLAKEITKVNKLEDFPHHEVVLELASLLGKVVTTDVKLRIAKEDGFKLCKMLVKGICGNGE